MLRGLTPEGLADFNQIVGVEHWIRPFVAEDVDLRRGPDGKHPLPLLEGLYSDDVYMKSGMYSTRMPVQTIVAFAAADAWTFVVDLDDIAPWCALPDPEYWQRDDPQPGSPDDPRNMVNGFTCSWRLGLAIPLEDDQPKRFTITLPAEREIDGFSFANAYSKYFKKTTKLRLGFDSGDPVALTLQAAGGRQDFTFPARTTKTLTVELLEWTEAGAILDVVNLWIRPKRTKAFSQKVQPLLNIGVLVKYPMGKGGVILNQMNIVEQETNPANAVKKQRIMDVLLKNLK